MAKGSAILPHAGVVGLNRSVLPASMPEPVAGALARYLNKLEARREVRGVALAGSWARGRGGPRSDVDLLVVTSGDVFVRAAEWVDGIEIQVMEGPPAWFRKAFGERRVASVQRMMAECLPLWDPDGLVEKLRTVAAGDVARGPDPPDPVAVRRARFRVTESLDDLLDLASDPRPDPGATALARAELLADLLDAFWLTRHRWPEKAKYALEAVRTTDPKTAEKLARLALSPGDDPTDLEPMLATAAAAADAVLGPVGGLLRKSWSLPPEPVEA